MAKPNGIKNLEDELSERTHLAPFSNDIMTFSLEKMLEQKVENSEQKNSISAIQELESKNFSDEGEVKNKANSEKENKNEIQILKNIWFNKEEEHLTPKTLLARLSSLEMSPKSNLKSRDDPIKRKNNPMCVRETMFKKQEKQEREAKIENKAALPINHNKLGTKNSLDATELNNSSLRRTKSSNSNEINFNKTSSESKNNENIEILTKISLPKDDNVTFNFNVRKGSQSESKRDSQPKSILKLFGAGPDINESHFKRSPSISNPSGHVLQTPPQRKNSRQLSSLVNLWKNISQKKNNQITPEEKNSGEKESKKRRETNSHSKLGVFKVLTAVSKFKSLIKYKRYENLNSNQLNIINDWAYYSGEKKSSENEIERMKNAWFELFLFNIITFLMKIFNSLAKATAGETFTKCKDCFASKAKKIKLFNPRARWKMTWDLFNMILIFWNFLIISIVICFGKSFEEVFLIFEYPNSRDWCHFFLIISFLNFMVDKLITLNTSYYEMGVFVTDRKKIIKNYIKNHLIIDLIAEIPFIFLVFSYQSSIDIDVAKYLNSLFFLKYYNLKGVFKMLEDFLALNDKYEAFFSLTKLFLKIFFVAHLLACLWHGAAYFGRSEGDQTWLIKKNLTLDNLWSERYIYSLYFALTTMTTVGYGDISPQNQREVLVAVLTMLVGSAMFGYSINSIGELLKKMNKKEDELKKNITLLDRYMKSKKIDFELQARARKYLEFVWSEEKVVNNETSDEILQKLSSNIREEVLLQSNGKFLLNYPMLCKNFSEKTMRKLIYHIKPVRYSPEEIIFEEGDLSMDPHLYMIAHGEIELCLPIEKGQEEICRLKTLKENSSFGEVSFFTDASQAFTARSISYSTVYLLAKGEFLKIISENKEDWVFTFQDLILNEFYLKKEKFCMIRDKIQLYQDYEELQMKCYSCNDRHFIQKCPTIQYVPNKEKVILIYQHSRRKIKTQRRSLFKLRSKRRFNALSEIKEIKAKIQNGLDSTNDNINDDSEKPVIINLLQNEPSSDPQFVPLEPKENLKAQLKKPPKIIVSSNQREEDFPSPSISKLNTPTLKGSSIENGKRKSIDPNSQKNIIFLRRESQMVERPTSSKIIKDIKPNEIENSESKNLQNDNVHNKKEEHKEELFMMSFDYHRNFNKYFVHNNPESVILKMALKFKARTKKTLSQVVFGSKVMLRNLITKESFVPETSSPRRLYRPNDFHEKILKRQSTKKNFFQGD